MRAASCKQAGDSFRIEIERDTATRRVTPRADLTRALKVADAVDAFKECAPSHQNACAANCEVRGDGAQRRKTSLIA